MEENNTVKEEKPEPKGWRKYLSFYGGHMPLFSTHLVVETQPRP